MDVGFIGLGRMGSGIATRLLQAGHAVTIWNRSAAAAEPLTALGATVARRPEDALQGSVAFSMLADDEAVRAVGLDGALLAHAARGLVHGNLATISVGFARTLAAAHAGKGIGYVAAPVFGRPAVAAEGRLTVIAAGKGEHIARVRPLLEVIGRRTVVVGEAPEKANLFKVAGNFMLAATIETFGEALALVRKAGIEPELFYDAMAENLFSGAAFKGYGGLIVEEKYEPPGFALRLGRKDVDLALAAASEAMVPMPLASLMHDQFLEALNSGLSEKDWASLAALIARKAGLPVTRGSG